MLNMNYKRHIRFNHKTNHFAYIIDETEKSYLFFGLTHSPRTFRNKNVPLANKNYIIPMLCIGEKKYFSNNKSNKKFERKDGPIIRDLLKKYKNREIFGKNT